MVTLAPTCFCTVRKFCRKVVSDTSAHVGRVAARLRISAVVATLAIIAGAPRAPRLRWGYSRHRCPKMLCHPERRILPRRTCAPAGGADAVSDFITYLAYRISTV